LKKYNGFANRAAPCKKAISLKAVHQCAGGWITWI